MRKVKVIIADLLREIQKFHKTVLLVVFLLQQFWVIRQFINLKSWKIKFVYSFVLDGDIQKLYQNMVVGKIKAIG